MLFKFIFGLLLVLINYVKGVPLNQQTDSIQGLVTPHIVGGINADEETAPYAAALVAGEDITILFCGGSIVRPNLILTAAHCITVFVLKNGGLHETFHGIVGSKRWNRGGTEVQFKDHHIHPHWDSSINKNDIGFLSLTEPLTLGRNIKVVALDFYWVDGDEPSLVTGWGRISNWGMSPFHLQTLDVSTVTPRQCVDQVKVAANLWGWTSSHVDPSIEICTFHSLGKGLCHGDSGSPLISKKSGKQIGIASWAFTCAQGYPDMYARISGFKTYIREIMSMYE
ncbi:chymotrypsin-2-like [Trichoplusia ni]|uniref:Chymotrypsin-2-like n=1 Tax=Trichoplusia ni TaxID=7111 RepID=A0A7E5WNW8_TRINI|nr:chymotrypsin-2-like [Trichoplusia ni]